MKQCKEAHITFNRKKMMLGRPKFKSAGYVVGKDGIELDPAKMKRLTSSLLLQQGKI